MNQLDETLYRGLLRRQMFNKAVAPTPNNARRKSVISKTTTTSNTGGGGGAGGLGRKDSKESLHSNSNKTSVSRQSHGGGGVRPNLSSSITIQGIICCITDASDNDIDVFRYK